MNGLKSYTEVNLTKVMRKCFAGQTWHVWWVGKSCYIKWRFKSL